MKKLRGKKDQLPVLTQPFLVDEAEERGVDLHPRLRKLWQDNYWKALGKPCPYKRREPEEDEESVEQVRRGREVDESGDEQSDLEVPMPDGDDEAGKKEDGEDDFDMPPPDDDDEEDEPVDAPAVDFYNDDEEAGVAAARGDEDDLDLGLVNDMSVDSEDEDAEDRQALGDVASSATKWHKHTVRVFQHLKKSMRDPDQEHDSDDEEQEDLPAQVEFHEITKKVTSRRNAASIFFEMLQLKTWDFIEVEQTDAYGAITISPGVRFSEAPPN